MKNYIKSVLSADAPVTDKDLLYTSTSQEGVAGDVELRHLSHRGGTDKAKGLDTIVITEDNSSDNADYETGKGGLGAVRSENLDPLADQLSQVALDDEYAGITVEDDSPYPEVRAAVPSSDDTSLCQNTLRMWTLGMIMTTIGCGLNMLFSMHSPSIVLSSYVTAILAWPLGRAWDKVMPNKRLFGKWGPQLNPGPFNVKEHALITAMGNVAFGGGSAYATDILLSMNNFYGRNFGWGFNLLATWSTQCIGFALAGLSRKVLVDPASMIWPGNLVSCTFLTNMHVNENHVANGWTISRLKFFLIVFICGFVYYWFPGFIFQALSYFAWITWIKPNNVVLNQVFGASTGLGLFPLTFDWNQIAGYIGSPLIPPVGAIFSILLSMIAIFWIVVPAVHYSNVWYGKYLPISDSASYDRFQNVYQVKKIITENLSFDKAAYEQYSPLYLSAAFAISYGLSFASMTATIMHAAMFHGRDIWAALRRKDVEKEDVHNRLMKQYKDVPHWWYGIVFLVFFALAVATIRAWPTEMPVFTLIIALMIAAFFLLPVGIIFAVTNISVGLNVITEFIIGYMTPGKPIAMMFFKTFGYITNSQAIYFAQDMKLGHYMKVAPRTLFWAQMIATVWGALVQVCVMTWAQGNIKDICTSQQASHFTCPGAKVFFNASIIWGVIGPQRIFSAGQIYNKLMYFFILGAGLPVMNWAILKKWPNSLIKYVNWPVFFSGTGLIPPATPYNYGAYCMVGIGFGYFVKKRFFHWWTKYNYSLSAGLDISLAWSSLIVFVTLGLTNTDAPSWWGNNVINTLDYNDEAIQRPLASGESFGLTTW
ncbi:LAME_0F03532g1_1 [Lachancea meyersii CBS 8951]|uniref:LAME_0F03532g1_1 n=1 Tax=Lachancea meyersii CBS 8951 TaxID=1266667 RepID=A0A1G4JRQ1_9SACH|nr:LAME_0F03532g1_1 [Lachancea meyersii CBS 8951]